MEHIPSYKGAGCWSGGTPSLQRSRVLGGWEHTPCTKSGCWGQGVHSPARGQALWGGRGKDTWVFYTPPPPTAQAWEVVLEFRLPPERSGAAPGGAPAALPGAARCPGRAMEQVGPGGPGRGRRARGDRRTTKATTAARGGGVLVGGLLFFFFPLAIFFFPGCCSFQHLLKERIVHTCVCFKRCFFNAAKLEEDEGQCMPCTWFSLKIVVLSKMDCESFRGKEGKT